MAEGFIMHPDTIKYPKAFDKSQWHIICPYCENVVGFDGVFHWGWVLEAMGYDEGITRIQPMDFDGVIERNYHYLIFETKDIEKKISQAQEWTLQRLRKAKSFTIMKVWGKIKPECFEISSGKQSTTTTGVGIEKAKEAVKKWFEWADRQKVD